MLRPEDIADYKKEGAIFPLCVLSPAEVSKYRSAFEDLSRRLGGPQKYIGWSHLYFDWAYDLACHPNILNAVEAILGPDVLIQGTLILCKHPHDRSYVSWHQDGLYSHWHSLQTLSAWVALSDSTSENGCLRIIPGSHKQGVLPHKATNAPDNLLRKGEEIQVEVKESEAKDIVLKAGEMSLLQSYVIHGSSENRSNTKRIGFIVRFVTSNLKASRDPVIQARGQAKLNHLSVKEEPPNENLEESIKAWRAHCAQRAQSS